MVIRSLVLVNPQHTLHVRLCNKVGGVSTVHWGSNPPAKVRLTPLLSCENPPSPVVSTALGTMENTVPTKLAKL